MSEMRHIQACWKRTRDCIANQSVSGNAEANNHRITRKEEKALGKQRRKAEKAARKAAKKSQNNGQKTRVPQIEMPKNPLKSRRRAEKESIEAFRLSRVDPPQMESDERVSRQEPLIHCGNYAEDPVLTNLPQSDIEQFMAANGLNITDSQSLPLRPILSFDHLPQENLFHHFVLEKFQQPTTIQSASWPYAFAGRDIVGVAETGSGKTLAFGLPLALHITTRLKAGENTSRIKRSPLALVISPTRELAVQIHEQIAKLGASNSFNVATIFGGVPKEKQTPHLRKVHCCVATPGRLRDYMQELPHKNDGFVRGDRLDLSRVRFVVLDEADRMLDTGFEDDVREILRACAETGKRQTLMYTATWPASVRAIADEFMCNPVKIVIGDREEIRANTSIKQVVEVIEPRDKNTRLLTLLKQHTKGTKCDDRILIFALYKKEAARIEEFIRDQGFRVTGIHGDLSQQRRMESLEAFKSGEVPMLVATDVAARGLDIPAVKVVINVTFPLTTEAYVHRIGRTGRAGQAGLAVTLFTENDKANAGGLMNVLKAANQEVPEELLRFGTTVKTKAHDVYGRFVKQDLQGQIGTKTALD